MPHTRLHDHRSLSQRGFTRLERKAAYTYYGQGIISLDTAARLMEEGVDMDAFERRIERNMQ